MDIGLLSTFIFITKNEVIVDAIGNHKNAWIPYYHCHATVSSEAGKENTDAGLVIDNSKIDFTIRWCKKAAAIDSTHYRVEFNGELYDIKTVDHMNFKRKCIKLSCEKVRQ
jgi:SPP1 family predicted phage head-tail adaptor|nr:MAG TPA: Putative head tail adaptor [Caudoviricetes sp.]